MKKVIHIVPAFVLLLTASLSCKKKYDYLTGCLTGKLVAQGPCGQYVVQITGGSYNPGIVEASWTNRYNSQTYTNVFSVNNYCDFGRTGILLNSEFTFRIISNPEKQDCVVCDAIYPTPHKGSAVEVSACR